MTKPIKLKIKRKKRPVIPLRCWRLFPLDVRGRMEMDDFRVLVFMTATEARRDWSEIGGRPYPVCETHNDKIYGMSMFLDMIAMKIPFTFSP